MIETKYIELETRGNVDIFNITPNIEEELSSIGMDKGIVTISVIGSTSAVTTCEFEPGLVKDLAELFDKIIPDGPTHHDKAWGDGNGHSHLRSSLLGPSITLPFSDKQMIVGTWQQVIYIDFDNRPRSRKVVLQFMGE